MIARLGRIHRRFIRSTRGVAAIEFAAIMPVLLLMFLASYDASNAIAIDMKVRAATYTLGAITNQYTTIQSTDIQAITGAASVVLSPYSSSPLIATVSQIYVNSKGTATVSWSYSLNGTAHAPGASINIPTSFAIPSSYLIFAEVSYKYTPSFGYFITGTLTLSDNLYVTPRSSSCIMYPPQNVTSC